MTKVCTDPLQEAIARKLSGFAGVPPSEQATMIERAARTATRAISSLREFAESVARCPCCDGVTACDPLCTFVVDMKRVAGGQDDVERMDAARQALADERGRP